MDARKATYEVLDTFKKGEEFTGYSLAAKVQLKTGEIHYPATCLRYIRSYREIHGKRRIVNIHRHKSLYRVL